MSLPDDNIDEMRAVNMFDFGANWQEYSQHKLDNTKIQTAKTALAQLLDFSDLSGKNFLDIGCGTGLHCLAAILLGASPLVGLDINPKCTALAQANVQQFVKQTHECRFVNLSVLDQDNLATLGRFDIVYAWGSLHHTGNMYQAIRNAAKCVAPGGTFVLAIYNKSATSPIWRTIKRTYNALPTFMQKLTIACFVPIIWLAKLIVTRKNPFAKERGMDFYYDVVDWIGGYPYEYATAAEMIQSVQSLGFTCRKTVPPMTPIGCNEFVFTNDQKKA